MSSLPLAALLLAILTSGVSAQENASWSAAYQTWAEAKLAQATATERRATADADGDRLSNFHEFALGTDPSSGTQPSAYQRQQLAERDGRHYPEFFYRRAKQAAGQGVRYLLQSSKDLRTWADAEVVAEPGYRPAAGADGQTEEVRHLLRRSVEETGPVYLRLAIDGLAVAQVDGLWPTVLQVKDLDGKNGFAVFGADDDDLAGGSVAGAGDVNGDGVADFIVGARGSDANGDDSGASYVIFGTKAGFPATLRLGQLDGKNGFGIVAVDEEDRCGSVSAAGDVNGDGVADVLVGSSLADLGGKNSGAAHVIFGRKDTFPAKLGLAELNGANGFAMIGGLEWDRAGVVVANAGDLNGDGVSDISIGADLADPNAQRSGKCYVVFGRKTAFPAALNLEGLNGTDGFILNGTKLDEFAGRDVAGIGDLNGDGVDDLAIGTADRRQRSFLYFEHRLYVLFGRKTGFPARADLDELSGANGFAFAFETRANEYNGPALAGAGDLNGDGLADLVVANAQGGDEPIATGEIYVVYGSKIAFPNLLHANTLNGVTGFKLIGIDNEDLAGSDVDLIGDINADGLGELLIGAMQGDAQGTSDKDTDTGEAYVVFGSKTFPALVPLASLNGTNGFTIHGLDEDGFLGRAVSRGGDLNGDGVADFILGGHRVDFDPNSNQQNDVDEAGAAYVIFGRK